MKLNQKLLCILSALAICLSVTLPVFAEDETELLRVYPKETSGGAAMVARQTGADAFTAHTSSEAVVERSSSAMRGSGRIPIVTPRAPISAMAPTITMR